MLQLFFDAAWKVLVAGLVLGAGLPALFAAGVRFNAVGVADDGTVATGSGSRTVWVVLAWLCFGLAALAVALGLMVIIAAGFGKEVSFEHVFPTLQPKA